MVLAADFYVAAAADFSITLDQGAPGLDAGDTVTWNGASPVGGLVVGSDAFTTIQAAINAAAPGETIELAAGTYVENLTIGKPLTIVGAGSGDDPAAGTIITAAASGSPTIGYTAGGTDVANRQTLKNVRITGARGGTGNNNSGILLSGGSMGYFTFDNVVATGNGGSGMVSNVAPATSMLSDVVIQNSSFSGNGANGIRTASHSVNGFSLSGSSILNNAGLGLAFNSSDNSTAQIGGVSLDGVTFGGNNGVADLYAFRMLGSMSLTNVDFTGSKGSGLFGLYLLGGYVNQASAPAIGTVTLDDVTVSGTYTSAGISFLGYSTLANVSMTDVVLDTVVPTANRGHLRLSGVAGTLNVGNTAFNPATAAFDVVMNNNFGATGSKSTVAVDATAATFGGKMGAAMTLTERFAEQNRMIDLLDGTLTGAEGLVTFVADNLFVTAANARVQPAFTAASAGDAIWIQAGTSYPAAAIVAPVDDLTVDVPEGVGAFTTIELAAGVSQLTATGAGALSLTGNGSANIIAGNDGPNQIRGGAENDILTGNGGDDGIDGGAGFDTAVFPGNYADYTVSISGANVVVTGPSGTDTLTNIERLQFIDRTVLVVGGAVGSEYTAIQPAIAAAVAGDVVLVSPGTYTENITIDKQLTLVGAGSGTDAAANTIITAAAPGMPTVSVTAGGLDAVRRLVVTGVRITGATGTGNAGTGIMVSSSAVIEHLTFTEVVSDGNGGAGIRFNSTAPVADVAITGAMVSNNGAAGIEIASAVPSFVGLYVTGTTVSRNGTFGFSYNPNGTMSNVGTDFVFTDVTFDTNNTTGGTDQDDLAFIAFRGNATLTDVTVTAANPSARGILFSNLGVYAAAGNVTLSNVTVSGVAGKGGLAFESYDDVAGISLSNVDVSDVVSPQGQLVLLTQGTAPFALGTTTLKTLVLRGPGSVTAGLATFENATTGAPLDRAILDDNFTIADQVIDAVDGPGLGSVTWNDGNVYVTPASFAAPSTTVADVQRAVDVARAGETVWVQSGGYAAGAATTNVDDLTVNVGAGVTGFTGLVLTTGVAEGTLAGAGSVNLTGNPASNTLTGNTGDNVIAGDGGDDAIDGGPGMDTAAFTGNYADYTVTVTGAAPAQVITVVDNRPGSPDGTDTITNVERLRFADRTVNPLGLTLVIASSRGSLNAAETAEITFNLSSESTTFTVDDVLVTGGMLSGFGGSGAAYTATFTPAAGFVGPATVAVPAGSFTDDVGTPNVEATLAPPIAVDTVAPTVAVTASVTTLGFGQSATLAFVLTKPAIGFEAAVMDVTGGTLSGFTMLTPTSYTAVFTPLAGFTGSGNVVVPAAAFTDTAGNPNLAATLTQPFSIDTVQPTVAIVSDRASLAAGQTALITFTLSEPAPGFIKRNVDVSGGTLSPLTAINATTYTGVFTPTPGFRGEGTVTVAAAAFTGASGNPNLPGVLATPLVIATQRPSVTVLADAAAVLYAQTAELTFVLDEPTTDFTAESVVVAGGTLTGFAGSGRLYTASFVPAAGFRGAGTVVVPAAAFRDAFGNASLAGGLEPALSVDTLRPRVTVSANRDALVSGAAATITFSLSQPSTTFSLADVVVSGGVLRNFSGGGRQYTATFVPLGNFVGSGTVDVPEAGFTGGSGNPNVAGGLAAPLSIDTARPTVTISADQPTLKLGQTAVIRFDVSRPTTEFRGAQVVVSGGTIANFAGSGTTYTAVFRPAAGFVGNATVSVRSAAFKSTAGNLNVAGSLGAPIAVDTVRPTVRITTSTASLRAGQTAAVTFVLGRPSADFTADDVSVRGGTLADFTGSGNVYTAFFTPHADFVGSGAIEVAAGAFTSTAGNASLAGKLARPISIDTVQPSVTIAAGRKVLGAGVTSRLMFTLDRPSTTFRPGVIAVTGGTLSQFQGSGRSYTAVFTPLANFTGTGTVTVPTGAFRSTSGNANLFSALATPLTIDTVRPTVTIATSRTSLGPGETATISFLLSRPSADFTAADVTVSGGTLQGFAGSGSSYSALFIPRAGYRGQGTISVAAGRFTGPTGTANRAGTLDAPITIDAQPQVLTLPLEAVPPARRLFPRWWR